ncbi:MAG: NAD(P)-dependent glycerol-3-phosphate dehydrogenase [Burkholderiales bacterium]|nr:NAD(P)-dependent glycerol-3-phosphate dehydrogenase [Burkholderiales bacterium]
MNLLIAGAGAWGTALAIQASQRHTVTLWARQADHVQDMVHQRINHRYLPGIALPDSIALSNAPLHQLLPSTNLVLLAVPMASLRGLLTDLATCASHTPVVWLCKGFEATQSLSADVPSHGLLAHEVQQQVASHLHAGVLSGPSFAQEVASGLPAALVAASQHAHVRDALVQAFHGGSLRIYANDDVVGVEIGGAVKNVMAIATGLCDGLQLGMNARAALVTRGLAEMTRLGMAMGARADTFMGLSGLGDLVLTATGDLSRNRQVGMGLAQGRSLPEVLQALGHVAEGVYSARTVVQRAHGLGVDMPIAQAVVSVLEGKVHARDAVAALMGRGAKGE